METILLFNFFGPEMLVIFFAILLLFGGKELPELMQGFGTGFKEFKNATKSDDDEEADKEKK